MKLYPKRGDRRGRYVSKEDLAHIKHLRELRDEPSKVYGFGGGGKPKACSPSVH